MWWSVRWIVRIFWNGRKWKKRVLALYPTNVVKFSENSKYSENVYFYMVSRFITLTRESARGGIGLIIYIITWILYILQGVVSGINFHFWKEIPMRCQPSRYHTKTLAISTTTNPIKIIYTIPTIQTKIFTPSHATIEIPITIATANLFALKTTQKHQNIL